MLTNKILSTFINAIKLQHICNWIVPLQKPANQTQIKQ
jgi:hypothetical protein